MRRVHIQSAIAGPVSLVPDNTDQAIRNEQLLIGNAVTGGGLSVKVWTNKGRDQEVLVFEEGEEVQFYVRVNQIVALPYQFMVVPPFGVERLIVTGYSQEPPPADTPIRGQLWF